MKKTWHSHFQVGILILSSLVLAAYAFFFPSTEQLLGGKPQYDGKKVTPLKAEDLDTVKKQVTTPFDWVSTSKHRLFLSKKYLYFPDKSSIEEETEGVKVGEFNLGWLQKYDLPILDPTVATQDPDGDGFTNIMEYNSQDLSKGTNPIDPQSHPAYVSRLRVKDLKSNKVSFKFTSVQQLDGQDVYSIIVETDDGRKSYMKKKGDKIEGFEILNFNAKKEVQKNASTGSEESVDVSELEVENTEMEMKTVFIVNQAKNIPDINVTFVLALVDLVNQPFKVARGKIFDVRGEKFRLLDASPSGAKIKNVDSNQEFTIPQLSTDDFRMLPQKTATK
ncbi:MAG: Amuc_1099 family pilus-like system protein [Verrucomicrobiota bacterium]